MAANKVYCLSLAFMVLSCLIISNHRVHCGNLEKLAALALILRAQKGSAMQGLTGIGGARYVPIPIYIKKKKEEPKKEKVKVIYLFADHDHMHMEPEFLHDYSLMNDLHIEEEIKLPKDWWKHYGELW